MVLGGEYKKRKNQFNALIFFHLEEHTSARHLVQILREDKFARENIAPEDAISKNSFSEAVNERGPEQLFYVFQQLQRQACSLLPEHRGEYR